ncbi:MAG TPA: phage tail tube protein, partial [Rhizobiaceae bacterium]|nr:phage tail tube protein [Rhizobiaceae bacterium]
LRSAWSTDVLKNGIAHKTMTIEKTFEQGATDSFIRYRGCRVNTMDLTLEARQIARVSFGIVGIGSPTPTTAILSGATYTAPNTNPVLNAATNIGALTVSGVVGTPKIRSLSMSIRSNIYQNDVIGQYEADSHGLGRFEVSGSATLLFDTLAYYNAILDHSDVGLEFTLGAATGDKYTFELPALKLMNGSPVIGGNSQAVIMEVPFQAKYDAGIAATMQITREVA